MLKFLIFTKKYENNNVNPSSFPTTSHLLAHDFSADDKNSWTLIEQKALSWLKKKLPDVNIEQVISNIQALVK